jgi:hypothetical protein
MRPDVFARRGRGLLLPGLDRESLLEGADAATDGGSGTAAGVSSGGGPGGAWCAGAAGGADAADGAAAAESRFEGAGDAMKTSRVGTEENGPSAGGAPLPESSPGSNVSDVTSKGSDSSDGCTGMRDIVGRRLAT